MAYITIQINDRQAQAAIIVKSTIEDVKNPFGGNIFFGENLLTDSTILENVIKDIHKSAQQMTRNTLDSLIIVHPAHISKNFDPVPDTAT